MAENKFFRMTTAQLVSSKDKGAKSELARRGRDAQGRRKGAVKAKKSSSTASRKAKASKVARKATKRSRSKR
jgi:hypothetical protein